MPTTERARQAARSLPRSFSISRRGWHVVAPTWIGVLGSAAGALIASGIGLWWYASRIEPYWVQWRSVTLPIVGLPAAFDGYRIVQLSDLHFGKGKRFGAAQLAGIARRVNRLRPDCIALTGDFVSHFDPVSEAGIQQIARLRAADGLFCVPGNHDYWNGEGVIERAVTQAGGQWLINRAHVIRRADAVLTLAGVDDCWEGRPDLAASLRDVAADACVILLAHEPNFADITQTDPRVVVQLSGHSHGGQVRVPGFGPVMLPDQAWRYPMGLYSVQRDAGQRSLWVYTNRGLGMAEMGYRLFCRPEVTLFTLRTAPSISGG